MKDLWLVVLFICGGAGLIASLVVAFCPCWVLVKAQTKAGRIIWKVLGFFALWGWIALFVEITDRLGTGELSAFVGLGVTASLIYTAAIRGEQVARYQGKFEDHRDGVRYVVKK